MIERLTKLAEENNYDAQKLLSLFNIPHDRTNNGGTREVIEILIQDGDDPDWIEDMLTLRQPAF